MHMGWPYFKEMASDIAVVACTESTRWPEHVWSCLILLWWFLDIIIMSVLAISFDTCWTDCKGTSICSWFLASMSFSSALPHLGLAFCLVLANGKTAYVTRAKTWKVLVYRGLSSWCSWNLTTKPRLAYWRMRYHVEKKLVVSQPQAAG